LSFLRPPRESIKKLAKVRNRLQHYGLPPTGVGEIESLVGRVLDTLLVFVEEQLLPIAESEYRDDLRDIEQSIGSELNSIRGLAAAREERLAPELDPYGDRVFACPDCENLALVIKTGEPPQCLFCGNKSLTAESAAESYCYTFLREYGHRPIDVCEIRSCPVCNAETLVKGVVTRTAPKSPVWACFTCGITRANVE
jgi:transcription elongation factor Elf1